MPPQQAAGLAPRPPHRAVFQRDMWSTATASVRTSIEGFVHTRTQLGLETATNRWFSNNVLRSEQRAMWCEVAIARLDTVEHTLGEAQDNMISVAMVGTLYGRTLAEGCWAGKQAQYLAVRHRLSAKGFAPSIGMRVFARLKWLPDVGKLFRARQTLQENLVYTPRRYCMDIAPQQSRCDAFAATGFVTLAQAQDIDHAIKGTDP